MRNNKKGVEESYKSIVLIKTTNSRKIYLFLYLMILILIAVLIFIKITNRPLDIMALKLVAAFVIALAIATELHRVYNIYEIHDNSLIHTQGILSKHSRKIDFSAISDLYVIQNLWQRILSYGNVEVRLFSGENTTYIKNINKPSEFVEIILRKINQKAKRG